ncbi:MAG: nucleoside triphosphate pyrophosphohydrolase [Candidatus Methanomethylophilaceae archaeon]|nr:nucleoside triphosphate pyrophosphohydrolase [Candidatus Methanomethylophilaceae archaeon]
MAEKLVRDGIPGIIRSQGRECECRVASEMEMLPLLTMKLDEEVMEYKTDRNIEELADIMEVLVSLAEYHGFSEDELIRECHRKRKERGSFTEGIVLRVE